MSRLGLVGTLVRQVSYKMKLTTEREPSSFYAVELWHCHTMYLFSLYSLFFLLHTKPLSSVIQGRSFLWTPYNPLTPTQPTSGTPSSPLLADASLPWPQALGWSSMAGGVYLFPYRCWQQTTPVGLCTFPQVGVWTYSWWPTGELVPIRKSILTSTDSLNRSNSVWWVDVHIVNSKHAIIRAS